MLFGGISVIALYQIGRVYQERIELANQYAELVAGELSPSSVSPRMPNSIRGRSSCFITGAAVFQVSK